MVQDYAINRRNIHKDNYIEKTKIETTIMGENNLKRAISY
jgi:hypothetical protein